MTNWKEYETIIFEKLKSIFPSSKLDLNQKLLGRFSKTKRQIDILIIQDVGESKESIAVECKYYNSVIDVKIVEAFISMLNDIGVSKGIIVTNVGFSKAAEKRAFYDEAELELDIFNFNDLNYVQADVCARFYPHYRYKLDVEPPFGFIVDNRKGHVPPFICFLFLRGLTMEEAFKRDEWIELALFPNERKFITSKMMIDQDKIDCPKQYTNLTIEDYSFNFRGNKIDNAYLLKLPDLDLLIYRCFLTFDFAILAVNLYTKPMWKEKNLRKLNFVINTVELDFADQQEIESILELFKRRGGDDIAPGSSINLMITKSMKE